MNIFSFNKKNINLFTLLVFLFLLLPNAYAYASEAVYTIQTGAFSIEENALRQFDSISQKLNEEELYDLRIERRGRLNIVRIGKFENFTEAKKIFQVVKPLYPDAYILKGYIIDEKIIKLYSEKLPADDPEKVLVEAREFVNRGDYKEALSLLYTFTSEPMSYPEIFSDYIVILVWDERYGEAIEMYENLPPSFPIRAYLMRNIAKAYYEEKEFENAASLYQEVLSQMPSDWEAQKGLVYSIIQTQTLEGDYVRALRLYRVLAGVRYEESEQIYRDRDVMIDSLPDDKSQIMLDQLRIASQEDEEYIMDYLLVLIFNKDYNTALNVYETADLGIESYSDNMLSKIAWAYFKTGDNERAKNIYNMVLDSRPDYAQANIGMSYCLSAEGQGETAIKILDGLLITEPDNIEIRFARAFSYEQMGMFLHAISEYDQILEIFPENPVARRLKLQALSDLGASSLALEGAFSEFPDDMDFHASLEGDIAVDRINWDEYAGAKGIILPLLENRNNLRARFDHIIALAKNEEMEDVVKNYESLLDDGISPPSWILEDAASAYLYLEQPYKALELYNRALELNPDSFNARRGKFYTLQELRKWDEAEEVLDSLDREIPEVIKGKDLPLPNWPKLELSVDRGWLIIYEERYKDADEYFSNLYERAPANTGIRSGHAHVHLWRGWPRKALREFKIIETLDPKYKDALIGKALALNTLAFKEDARDVAEKLMATHPRDKHVRRLVRKLEVEEMSEITADFIYTKDDEGFEDIRSETTISYPVSLYTTLHGFHLWQKSSDDNQKNFYRRAGLGATHIFNSSWSMTQRFSVNYNDGKDFGSLTYVRLTPDDYWSFSLSYDSFATDVPLRARVFGIEADKIETSITYRESEWRSYHLLLSHMEFSDSNKREEAIFNYEQGLFVKNDWKIRVLFELYMSRNSRDDAPYFNPDHDFSLSSTLMTQHTVWRIYNRAFVHKLFLTVGNYKQSGFGHRLIGSIRYQQEHDFSDTQALLWGGTVARQVYDGNTVSSYSLYLTYRGRF